MEEETRLGSSPKFIDSPYFGIDDNGFYLKPGAPEDVKREFEEFMRREKEAEENGYAY